MWTVWCQVFDTRNALLMFMRQDSTSVDCLTNRLLGGFRLLLDNCPTTILVASRSRDHVSFRCLYESRCHLTRVRPWCLIHQDLWLQYQTRQYGHSLSCDGQFLGRVLTFWAGHQSSAQLYYCAHTFVASEPGDSFEWLNACSWPFSSWFFPVPTRNALNLLQTCDE